MKVGAVKNYIHQHYAEDLSLETLAEKVYLSSGYLSFIFKKETRYESESVYPCGANGKGKGAFVYHQHEGGAGQ